MMRKGEKCWDSEARLILALDTKPSAPPLHVPSDPGEGGRLVWTSLPLSIRQVIFRPLLIHMHNFAA